MNVKVIDAELTGVVGEKGQGKTSLIIETIKDYQKRCRLANRKCCILIDCATTAAGFTEYEQISLDDLANLPSINQAEVPFEGVYVVPYEEGVEYEERLSIIYGSMFNGLLILDESGTWFSANLKASYGKMFSEHRNRGIEMYFLCHGISEIPKKIRKHCNRIIYFQTGEYFHDFRDFERLGFPYPHELYEVVNKINNTPQKAKLLDRPTIQPYGVWDKKLYKVYEKDTIVPKITKKSSATKTPKSKKSVGRPTQSAIEKYLNKRNKEQ